MRKSIHSNGQDVLVEALRRMRRDAGLTQIELAQRLKTSQSVVSKVERGERRLDVLELRQWCTAADTDFAEWVAKLHRRLGRG